MYRQRVNHWSCSKFANKLRTIGGIEKPRSATMEGWNKYHTEQHQKNPVLYWVVENGLNRLQDIVYYPLDILYAVKVYLRNRFVTKTHLVVTDLEKGKWYEYDTRLLHVMFACLVNFVEIDCNYERGGKKGRFAKFISNWFVDDRSPENGVKHLQWEMSLGTESPYQSARSREMFDLYMWWTVGRPNRPDPYELVGLTELYEQDAKEEKRTGKSTLFDMSKYQSRKHLHDEASKIEQQYADEDQEMMHRLVDIRKSMWT